MQKYAHVVVLEKCCQTHFLAKFRFDTAENEPAKNLQKFAKFANSANPDPLTQRSTRTRPAGGPGAAAGPTRAAPTRAAAAAGTGWTGAGTAGRGRDYYVGYWPIFGKISAKCCSFSAVSAPIFATKYAFCSIFQNLPDYLAEIFEI